MFVTNAFGTPKNTELNQMMPFSAQEEPKVRLNMPSKMSNLLSSVGQTLSPKRQVPEVRLDIIA